MALDGIQPILERMELFAVGIGGVVVASQLVDLWTTMRARAGGATRAEAREMGRDAGLVTILAAVLLLAGGATFGLWTP